MLCPLSYTVGKQVPSRQGIERMKERRMGEPALLSQLTLKWRGKGDSKKLRVSPYTIYSLYEERDETGDIRKL